MGTDEIGGRMVDTRMSVLTKEKAKQLAEMVAGREDEREMLAELDALFPEWAPFEHALCTPCKECGRPVRWSDYCTEHRPTTDTKFYYQYAVHPSVKQLHMNLQAQYAEAVKDMMNQQNVLLDVFKSRGSW
jgi:hypothetical protein